MTRVPKSPKDTPEQWDLFGSRPRNFAASPAPEREEALESLDDPEIVALLPKANLSNVQGLCAQVIARDLGDRAVPALESLWRRFRGYGRTGALPEQRCALDTLARIGTPPARDRLTRIIGTPDLPDALLPLALHAAVTARLVLPLSHIVPWLDHRVPEVRALAFSLARAANPPENILETGLSDSDPFVRRAALITLGTLGHTRAKPGLLVELDRNPTGEIVRALATIADADILTRLGRCARRNAALKPFILEELADLDDPRADRIIRRF